MKRTLYTRGSIALAALMFGGVDPRPASPVPPTVPREFRAVYATPILDRGFRDWPSKPGLAPDSQRTELRALLDRAAAIGLNAVILHVRMAGDAIYPTPHAPWSAFVSERSGQAPSPAYDPLAFAVAEAHARGLQLHAWFNPFRAMLPIFAGKAAPSHVTHTHPEWIRKYGSQTWIDPGEPAARKHVLEAMLDVVRRYDIDGVHIDDYFYPYRESHVVVRQVRGKRVRQRVDIQFPDERTWIRYGKAKYDNRADWRRANVDEFVESLYKGVKAIKPGVLVGISPFGIWRSNVPVGVRGLDAFGEIYADSRKWLARGWLDYIAPQLYWQVDGTQDRFRALDAWWRQENVKERYVWPALYTSRVFGGSNNWPLPEIQRQVELLRDSRTTAGLTPGHVHFRFGAFLAQDGRLAHEMAPAYIERAAVPAFPWLGDATPAAPAVSIVGSDGGTRLSITPGDTVGVRWWVIQTRGRDGLWTTSTRFAGEGNMSAASFGTVDPDEIAVTALTMSGIASPTTIVIP